MQHKLPIGYLDTEDWRAAGGTLGIPTRAPHPHAAKVFVNWLLSREGQIALQKFGRPDAHNPAASIFQKTTSISTTAWKQARNISIWLDRSTKT